MMRKNAHSESKEPLLEEVLSKLRYGKIAKFIPRNAHILDLGCGFNGSFLKIIEPEISSAIGLDLSTNADFRTEKIRLMNHDLNKSLPFTNSEFDVVTSLANLEHLSDPAKNLSEIYRVLKPGGKLLLTTPSVYGKPVLEFLALIGLVSKQEIADHKNYFTKKILTILCREAQFSSVSHRYFQLRMNNFLIAVK